MKKRDFTKNYIADVFNDLLSKKSYKKISVVDICHAADISRMTFYNNFEDKIALTVWMVKKDIFNNISNSNACFWDFFQDMVIYVEKSRLFCLGMLNSSEHDILKSFYVKYMVSCLEQYAVDYFAVNASSITDKKAILELMAVLLIDAIENWILHYPDMLLGDFLQMCKLYLTIMQS